MLTAFLPFSMWEVLVYKSYLPTLCWFNEKTRDVSEEYNQRRPLFIVATHTLRARRSYFEREKVGDTTGVNEINKTHQIVLPLLYRSNCGDVQECPHQ